MLLIVLECAPPKMVGYCSSWGLQVATGVFVANVDADTRESIWEQIEQWSDDECRALMVFPSRANEQRIEVRSIGHPRRACVRREGLWLSRWVPRDEQETAV